MLNILLLPFRLVRWGFIQLYRSIGWLIGALTQLILVPLSWIATPIIAIPVLIYTAFVFQGIDTVGKRGGDYSSPHLNAAVPFFELVADSVQLKVYTEPRHRDQQITIVVSFGLFVLILFLARKHIRSGIKSARESTKNAADMSVPILWNSAPEEKTTSSKAQRFREKFASEDNSMAQPTHPPEPDKPLALDEPETPRTADVQIACKDTRQPLNLHTVASGLSPELQRLIGFKKD